METSDDEHGMKPLLLARDDNLNENRVVGLLKARKWFIVFGCALVLAVIIVVCFVATKSSSSSHCYSYSDSDDCFFKGITRLPKTLKPLTYEVQLQPNLTTFVFNGSVLIVVKCLETTNRVVFHQKGLSFDHTEVSYYEKLKGSSKGRKKLLAIDEMRLDSENEQVIWKMTESLEKGKEYSIAVSFHGKLNDKLEGFYKSSYKTYENGETRYRYLATTHFEATTARQAFPCFDEPAMKANFTIIMVHEIEYVALSNMPVESSIILDNKLNKTKFRESVKMSTYLVAFVVCDFAYVSATTERGVQIRIWAPKDQINETKLAADSARFILNYYEQYFHINYPLPKQDLIAIPDFSAGAMENWGLITYRLTALLSDDNESSDSNKQWVATVVAHELAHQWFGNLVTMKWWSDLWLNEGFASYMENVGVNQFRPRWKMMDQFVVTNVHRSMRLDQLANSHPISVVVKNPSEISSLFDDISYHKGASLIRMMSSVLGDEVFHHGLQSYLKQYAFGNAATDDLWHSLSENTTIDVKEVMDTWTRQMGFPLVTIQKEKDGRYLATQEHFLVNPDAKPALESPYNYKWHIPLTYRTNKDKADTSSSVTWMHRQDVHINVDLGKDDWLKANHGQIGFYRVNYPFDNWQKLANTLRNGHETLLPADRAGLIDDAFTLARAGKLNYTTPLEISLYLNKEFEYVPWSTAMSSLSYIGARLSMTPFYGLYQTYILSRVKPILKEIGYRDEGDNLRKYLRDILFGTATAYDYKPAVVEAQRMFSDFMSNSKRVPPNFRYTVYDSGVRQGAKAEWEFMWNKYERETVASEKRKLLSSLSNTREAWLLQRLLEYSLNSSLIKSQDADSVISSVAGNPNGRLLAWDFVRLNWDTLRNRYGSEAFSFGRLIKAVTAHFQTEFHYTEVKAFFDAHPDVGSAKRSLEQAFEAIRSNIRWVKEHQDDVVHWLRQQH